MDGATSTIIELISEDHDASESSSGVAKILITSGIHRELIEFVKKKVIDSIELQQFIVSREIEFYEKYVDYLTKHQSSYNNHNELDELQEASLNPEQRRIELSDAESKLEGLRKRSAALGKREQKACNSLSSGFKELKIMNSPSNSETLKYQVTNNEWICTLNNSISLQKIRMICEKLKGVFMKMEVSFWITEVGNLIEKLRREEKEVAFGIIVEMVTCPSGDCSNENLLTLVNTLIEKKEAKEHIFSNVNKWKAVSNETLTIEQYIWNVKVLAALFTVADQISQEKFKQNICELMIKTLENNQLEVNHLMGMITIFESVGPKLGNVLDRFDQIFSLFNAKSYILESSEQYRITHLMRFRSITSPPLDTPIIAAATLPRSGSSIRNITIIEHSETTHHQMKTPEELEKELRLKIAEEMRMEADRKKKKEEMIEEIRMRVREELMMEEQRKREEEGRKARRELEEARKAEELRLEKLRNKEEEDRKKKELEDAKRAEEMRIKKQKEEEDRKKKELEEETRRKVEEEKIRIAKAVEDAKKAEEQRIQRQQEEYKRNNPCTFITEGVRMYRHTDPTHHYERHNLDGKLIGLLFSGQWCQPCLNFVPYLRSFYSQVEEDFEVVFISSDRSEQEMASFLQNYHGDWFNLPFRSFEGERLKQMLGVQSIPTLLVFKPDGTYQNVNMTNKVMNCQNPRALINQWKNM